MQALNEIFATIDGYIGGSAWFTYLLIGQCEFAPVQFPQSFLCVTQPCYLGVSLGISIAVPTPFNPVAIQIPAGEVDRLQDDVRRRAAQAQGHALELSEGSEQDRDANLALPGILQPLDHILL